MRIKKLLELNAIYIAVILTLFIAITSLITLKGSIGIEIQNSDKLVHFIAYFFLGLSWLYALKKYNYNKMLIILFLIIYGIIIEVLQGVLTDYRTPDIKDAIANSIGIFVALLFFKVLKNYKAC